MVNLEIRFHIFFFFKTLYTWLYLAMLLLRNPTKFYTILDFARMFARGPDVM